MSFDVTWDVEKYREEHENEEQWLLRKAFIERWKDNYPEERLICLARVFTNVEFMGCRYPAEVMTEIATLSQEVAKTYRTQRKTKLQRTFVSASDAAEDRARGIQREGGKVKHTPPKKSNHIFFVKQGTENTETEEKMDSDNVVDAPSDVSSYRQNTQKSESSTSIYTHSNEYLNDLFQLECVDVKKFQESMFNTPYGRLVLQLRPWSTRLSNIQVSAQACRSQLQCKYDGEQFSILINGKLLAAGHGATKQEARIPAEAMAWDTLKTQVISVLVKEQLIAHNDAPITVSDVSTKKGEQKFGTPIESNIALKMMKLMGWSGGGLGAEAQGIEEPVKPHLQMVNRAGLGSQLLNMKQLKRAAEELMSRYLGSSSVDVDLVFSADFSKEERAALHLCAQKAGLASRSYGSDPDRFLVVKKKMNPFSLVKEVIEEGGNTAKYQVFIPVALTNNQYR